MSELKTIPESELVSAYIAGDENALVMLINRHEHKIFGFICSKVMDKSIAEDIFQETFIKVIKSFLCLLNFSPFQGAMAFSYTLKPVFGMTKSSSISMTSP